ncbi:MAG: peroxiredoxin [Verrucomicrobiota bacterium]
MIFSSSANGLDLETEVPNVSALDYSGEVLNVSEFARDGFALVFFFPKAETPGCIAQVCSLRDAFEELTEEGVRVLGVSTDSVLKQKTFHEKRSLPYPLIADVDKVVVKAFGVPTTFGFASRQAYLFKDGKLVWKDESAATKKQAEEVLAVVRSISG